MRQASKKLALLRATRRRCRAWMLLAIAALLAPCQPAVSHETDQYTLPAGRDFADLGPYFSSLFEAAVRAAVARTNDDIDAALASGRTDSALAEQSSDHVAGEVWAELFRTFPTNELLDGSLLSEALRSRYPGLVTLHWPVPSIYDQPLLLLDLSKFVRTFFRAGTVSAAGTVIGTDKVIHFVNVGRIYHAKYEELLARGQAATQAATLAISITSGNPFYSEDGFLGIFTTGIHSNADLAADLAGFKFYRNLTEPVRIGPRELPPMLVREGAHWRVQMQSGAMRFTAFITPHWNEVLNPNRYLDYVAEQMRAPVRERCEDVLDLYRDKHGRRMGRAQFEAIETELSSYFGEPYDHQSNPHGRVTVAEVCFAAQDSALQQAGPAAVDAMGRTPLWWAAREGQLHTLDRLLAQGHAVDAADLDGETPLHAAVRAGQAETAQRLLRHGSTVDATALYGVTPLMLTAGRGDLPMAQAPLDAGAQANLAGPFGRTPLHLAIAGGHESVATLLLRYGADPRYADDMGNTAAHLAARRGNARLLAQLSTMGEPVALPHAHGATPADEAARDVPLRAPTVAAARRHPLPAADGPLPEPQATGAAAPQEGWHAR